MLMPWRVAWRLTCKVPQKRKSRTNCSDSCLWRFCAKGYQYPEPLRSDTDRLVSAALTALLAWLAAGLCKKWFVFLCFTNGLPSILPFLLPPFLPFVLASLLLPSWFLTSLRPSLSLFLSFPVLSFLSFFELSLFLHLIMISWCTYYVFLMQAIISLMYIYSISFHAHAFEGHPDQSSASCCKARSIGRCRLERVPTCTSQKLADKQVNTYWAQTSRSYRNCS